MIAAHSHSTGYLRHTRTMHESAIPNATKTGTQLRSLYEPQGGTGHIFSAKVTDYVAARPDYPAALFTALRTECHLQPGAVVADIGAGTGLLNQGPLANGYTVTAIEPSGGMPDRASALGQLASQQIHALFQLLAIDDRVAVRYTTLAFLGRPQ